jgi:pSer/pThr/pTyr-binding forkhead associated (FHA) protein
MMIAKLTCKTGPLAGSTFFVRDEAVIGSTPDCTIYLRSGIISSRHARIFLDTKKGVWFLEDLKSFNGTRLDGENISGKKRLKTYHVIVLANMFEFIFQLAPQEELEEKEKPEPGKPPEPAAPEVSDDDRMARTILLDPIQAAVPPRESPPPAPAMEVYLKFKTVKGGEQSVLLKQGDNTIGRSTTSDILIDNPSISRHHAVLILQGDSLRLRDAGSRNGTFLDERRVTAEMPVTTESVLTFGLVKATVSKQEAHTGEGSA